MGYNAKTHKKCTFPKMGTKPLPPKRPKRVRFSDEKNNVIAKWRDGWFKGRYERPNDKF